jgi:putative transcriptional regulator
MIDFSKIEWRTTRYRGIYLHFLRRDDATSDATVFIRMEPGCAYPSHRHTGPEEVLVLQGGYRDDRGEHRAGDYILNEPGSAHQPIALDCGEDCILFAVAHSGIEVI